MNYLCENMAILSDKTIKEYLKEGKIGFEPLQDEKQIQPSSVDMRLGDEFKVFKVIRKPYIDPEDEEDIARHIHQIPLHIGAHDLFGLAIAQLHSLQGEYAEYEPIPFRWDPVPKATQCGLHIDRQDPDGSWQADYLVEQPAESGCTERLEAGTYRVLLRAENAKCAGEDGRFTTEIRRYLP